MAIESLSCVVTLGWNDWAWHNLIKCGNWLLRAGNIASSFLPFGRNSSDRCNWQEQQQLLNFGEKRRRTQIAGMVHSCSITSPKPPFHCWCPCGMNDSDTRPWLRLLAIFMLLNMWLERVCDSQPLENSESDILLCYDNICADSHWPTVAIGNWIYAGGDLLAFWKESVWWQMSDSWEYVEEEREGLRIVPKGTPSCVSVNWKDWCFCSSRQIFMSLHCPLDHPEGSVSHWGWVMPAMDASALRKLEEVYRLC